MLRSRNSVHYSVRSLATGAAILVLTLGRVSRGQKLAVCFGFVSDYYNTHPLLYVQKCLAPGCSPRPAAQRAPRLGSQFIRLLQASEVAVEVYLQARCVNPRERLRAGTGAVGCLLKRVL